MSDQHVLHWTSVFATPFGSSTAAAEERSFGRRRRIELHTPDRQEARAAVVQEPLGDVPVAEVLARLREGDRDALDLLYRSLFKVLWSLALLQTHSGETAEEIVHDVFLRLWIARETIRIDGDVRVYLSAAVRNAARNLRKHEKIVDDAAPMVQLDPPMASHAMPSDAIVAHEEFMAAYHRALTVLTEQERIAAYLRWEETWPFERIGEVLSLSKVGARKVVLRAQRKVQKLLAEFHG